MIYKIAKIIGISCAFCAVAACSDWLEPKPVKGYDQDYDSSAISPENEEYFKSLREWKQIPDLPCGLTAGAARPIQVQRASGLFLIL